MEGILPLIILGVISAVINALVKAGKNDQKKNNSRAAADQRLRRQLDELYGRPSAQPQPTAWPVQMNSMGYAEGIGSDGSANQAEGVSGSEGTGNEGTGSEGSTTRLRPVMAPRIYSANTVNAPAAAENAPFLAGREGSQVYTADAAISAYRRKPARRALAIGSALSNAEGMAQAVVMAEVLMRPGGRRSLQWKN